MTQYDWILGQPIQTDTTNFEWSLGMPYIVTEEVAVGGLSIPIAMYNYRRLRA